MHHISPSKTLEGVAGGVAAAAVVGALLVLALGRPVLAGLVLGLALGLAAQVGDLTESMLKRAAGAKESGRLIPGHGGLLDRVDSFLFAAPVAYFYVISVLR
jgi:phosphatidate cytidylyltransferase